MEYQEDKVHWEVNTGHYAPEERGLPWYAAEVGRITRSVKFILDSTSPESLRFSFCWYT